MGNGKFLGQITHPKHLPSPRLSSRTCHEADVLPYNCIAQHVKPSLVASKQMYVSRKKEYASVKPCATLDGAKLWATL